MAKFRVDGLDELLKHLEGVEERTEDIVKDAMLKAEPIVVDSLKSEISQNRKAEVDETRGQLAASVKATKPKPNAMGMYDFVRPTGTDSKGVRNMEKLAYLEYGTSKQQSTPVCAKVKNRISREVAETMESHIKKEVEG